ncbi:MAG: hypothetical protein K6E79_04435 [Pseudobutyrivibrio sp.]|nr:hypothetical protein [Pseudobutyrivibrio sp.]
MAIGEIISCFNAEDLYRKAEDLSRRGIKTEFAARYTLRVVSIQHRADIKDISANHSSKKNLSIA